MSNSLEAYRPPAYFIRKRFFRNKAAVFGLIVIVIAVSIALLGFLIIPDKTPDANEGSVRISKKAPGFESLIIKIRQKYEAPKASFFSRLYFGEESPYIIEPIKSYHFVGDEVYFNLIGSGAGTPVKQRILDISRPTYASSLVVLGGMDSLPPAEVMYQLRIDSIGNDTTVRYLNPDKEYIEIKLSELKEEFKENNIEKRKFWLGTDRSGRDVLSRLLYGTRISLMVGLIAVLISVFLGVTLGALAGYFGGWLDDVITWLMTVVWSVPSIMLVIAISIAFQDRGLAVTFVAVGFTMWVEIARVVRGQMKATRKKLYIRSAKAFGLRNDRIIFSHILPNILGPIIVSITANFANAILIEAGLSFLGLGVQLPTPSWGMMLQQGFRSTDSWHLIF
ncbi:MAG: ABC transporter permease, partial [Bacteroidota bacterium]